MAKTWSDFIKGKMPESDYDLALLSDAIWTLGSLEDIQAAVSPEVFHLFVAMNAIGIWEGEGWGCLIGDNPVLVPHLPEALQFAGFASIADAVSRVMASFPAGTVFADDDRYCDVIRFLQNVRFKIADAELNKFTPQQPQ